MRFFSIGLLLLGAASAAEVRPILRTHCLNCHSTEKQKGDLDLEASDIHKEPHIWENVLDQIELGEMPPKKEKQLTAEEKKQLVGWVRGTLDQISLANAGDPGPVVLRRLSNMEYTYTLRDLTGVESLDPAREFPVDGAAGEGFTNAGAALVMSPALLTKYLDAAKDIASHAVLTPAGMHFSASTSSRDWTDETLAKIRSFYARYSESGGAQSMNLQGVKFDTNSGGRLPVAQYLDALQGKGSAEGLNSKYFATLRTALTEKAPSILLDPLRTKYREKKLVATDIEAWQQALWRFTSVGHIGKENGPNAWQEPVTPLVSNHEMRVKLTGGKDVTLYLTTRDAGDGTEQDAAVWDNPRLVAAGRPDLPISDLPALVRHLEEQRRKVIESTEACLAAIATGKDDADASQLAAWREYLGYGTTKLEPLLTKKLESTPDYNFIKGWTGEQALSVLANSSDASVRTPGLMKAHSVAAHPSPKLAVVAAWRSPVEGKLRISGDVSDAHPECGNGITWALEVRRGNTSETLASGVTQGATVLPMGPFENVAVMSGDVIALVIGPRDGNHVCDLTTINLTLHDGKTIWDLAKDVSPNILAGNPHGAWHFLSQPASIEAAPDLPAPMVEWRKAPTPELAAKVRQHLEREFPLNSPLLAHAMRSFKHGGYAAALNASAPSMIEVKIPAALAEGMEFVVTGKLAAGSDGSVQMQVLTTKPESSQGLVAGKSESALAAGQWSDNNLRTQHSAPIIVNENSGARKRFEAAFDEFRSLFPVALCYTKIVPVDEVVTLTLFHREDDHLKRLMLDEAQTNEIDRLWDELRFVSEAPLKQVDVFEQLYQFATQDAKPSAFEPMRQPIMKAAGEFKKLLVDVEPRQLQAVLDFATQAWRRPLSAAEQNELRALYQKLRKRELPHAAAVRMLIARVLIAPAFLYRGERAAPGPAAAPVSDWELATRLSFFLWSSAPDDELRAAAASGTLRESLIPQARRMMKDARIRRLATEFGCQWLHVRDVEVLDEKSERHFPTFLDLRDDMQEEVVRFFIDLFQENRGVLSLLDADHTFANGALAKHYDISNLKSDDWQRVDKLRETGRGGILGFAATLAKQSGASRTSPILRGTWLSEVILGDKLPIPPKGVPVLPEEAPQGLTERQLTERHSSDARCAGCHKRIDPFGFALEGFDAIGRARDADTKTVLPDGTRIDGLADLRSYLLTIRRDDFLRQLCRKLLGYSLGRSVQLSDKPLIETMVRSDHRIGTLIELIVISPQFLEVRGRDNPAGQSP